jgi:carbon storage regulator CsrA
MLIISRKKDQKIIVADEIEITILEVGRNRVRFGINAPKHIAIQTRLKSTVPPPDTAPPPAVEPQERNDAKTAAAAALGLP